MGQRSYPKHPLNPSWQALSQIDSVKKEVLELAVYLLQLDRFAKKETDQYESAGVTINSHILDNDPILDTALDLIGIPSDNTVELGAGHENSFCRDYIKDVFIETVVEQEDYDSFIKEANELIELTKHE